MKTEITSLQTTILTRISKSAAGGNIDEVTRLSALANRTKNLLNALEHLESEAANIQAALKPGAANAPQPPSVDPLSILDAAVEARGPNSTIEVYIDWAKNGHAQRGTETIAEGFGSTTMAKVMERLVTVLGPRALEVAAGIRVKRGPMISKDPRRDYWNPSAGKPYGHRRIKGTEYAVLTGTETDQKVSDLNTLFNALRLAPGSYKVTKVDR